MKPDATQHDPRPRPAKSDPKSPAQRVLGSQRRALQAGGRRTPRGILSPGAAQALHELHAIDYAPSLTACIERALLSAAHTPK